VSKRDYYEALGVTRSATEQEIKSAYRRLALKHHPDRNPGDRGAEEKFKEAAEAYAVLADSEKRATYDHFGHAGLGAGAAGGFDPSIFADFGDIFGGLGDLFGFGDIFGGRRRGGSQRGADLRYDLEITFLESARGLETSVQIPRQEACSTCHGSGAEPGTTPTACPRCHGRGQIRYQQGFFTVAQTCGQCGGVGRIVTKPCQPCKGTGRLTRERKLPVKIPPGIADGQRLRLFGEGEHGTAGGPPGDLYVVIRVQEHPYFRRDGDDLYCRMPVTFTLLTLGGDIKVPTLDGHETVRVPEGTQTGSVFRIRGKGMSNVTGRGRGDLHVVVEAKTPRKLTRDQRHLLEQLAKALPAEKAEPLPSEDSEEERTVFDRVKDIFS
jgi:molecular chaperone DnaJ